jgi:hypothetical protein
VFSSFIDANDKLLVNRLGRIQAQILALNLVTKEDYVAQLTSLVNRVLNLDYAMQPLTSITAGTPGIVGDIIASFQKLTFRQSQTDLRDDRRD